MAAAAYPMFDVKYHGFVYVDKPSGGLPEPSAINNAASLLKTKKKQARQLHPLFARGFDTTLNLQVLPTGLLVTAGAEEAVVMNNPLHKLAYVVDIGTCTIFLVKRDGKGKFKCHSFDAGSAEKARQIATETADVCNQLFRRVRKSIRRMTKRGVRSSVSDATEVSKMAEAQADEVKKAVEEPDEPGAEESTSTAASNIEFIDGVSDQLANLVLGDEAKPSQEYTEISLDDEMFSFGEITGEAEC